MFGWRRSARLCARPAYAPGPAVAFDEDPRQVEARTIVNAANTPGDASNSFVISQPGSYYLTGNINGTGGKNGISIQADGVTLDLNGFALIGEATGSGIGVTAPAPQTSLCVRNGTVRGWRSHGVGTLNASSSVLERLRAFNNGGDGLQISNESAVRDCVMSGNIGLGLFGGDRVLVSGCVADINTGSGIGLGSDVVVVNCLVSRGFATTALLVADRSTVSRCTVSRNAGTRESRLAWDRTWPIAASVPTTTGSLRVAAAPCETVPSAATRNSASM